MEKYYGARNTTDDNIPRRMRVACCVPKARQTLRICNMYYFSTAKVVMGIRLSVNVMRTLPVVLYFVRFCVTAIFDMTK